MKKYVRNMKKYVNILDLALPYLYWPWNLEKFQAPPSYSRWDLEKFHARVSSWALGLGKISIFIPTSTCTEIGSGTWKNSELCLYTGSGIWKMLSFPFLRLKHVGKAPSVARCVIPIFFIYSSYFCIFFFIEALGPRKTWRKGWVRSGIDWL